MSATQGLAPPQVRWNLSALFSSIQDPQIERTWQRVLSEADAFATKYRGRIEVADLDAGTLVDALRELEAISQEAVKPVAYSHLLFASDTSNPKHGAFMQKQMEKGSELSVKLMFFQLELQAAPEETIQRLMLDPRTEQYRHAIQVTRTFSPHRLTEPEEIILEETANTGSRAWVRFFEETTSTHLFEFEAANGKEAEEKTLEEMIAMLRDPDREVRQAAADSISKGLAELEHPLVFTYNNLLQDKKVEDRLRKHPYPEHSRHLSNELDKDTVDLVMAMCAERQGLVARFYRVKREILGLPELTHIDRYAPLFPTEEQVSYDRAREMVLDAFGSFSESMKARAQEFFESEWIDAEPRQGKQGGAFCSYNTPDLHPVVLMSYLNRMDDVMTLAHELGHGVHASLSREQTYFNFQGTLPLAELASTFGEMLVFEKLVASASPKDKIALYADKIEGIFATVFRQAAMFRFEQRAHEKRREHGELTPEEFGEMWQEELQGMFGDSVKLGDQHKIWWSYIGHFIFSPFYVYAYSFGELLALSLFQMAKEGGAKFEEKYLELLRQGGSRSPQELMDLVSVDLKSNSFWQGGFDAMERLVLEFERLWVEHKA